MWLPSTNVWRFISTNKQHRKKGRIDKLLQDASSLRQDLGWFTEGNFLEASQGQQYSFYYNNWNLGCNLSWPFQRGSYFQHVKSEQREFASENDDSHGTPNALLPTPSPFLLLQSHGNSRDHWGVWRRFNLLRHASFVSLLLFPLLQCYDIHLRSIFLYTFSGRNRCLVHQLSLKWYTSKCLSPVQFWFLIPLSC